MFKIAGITYTPSHRALCSQATQAAGTAPGTRAGVLSRTAVRQGSRIMESERAFRD
jgi:hypothetical protein